MTNVHIPSILSRSAWMLWCLLITLALMFISSLIGIALIGRLNRLFLLYPAIAGGLIGGIVGMVVGGFRNLCVQREATRSSIARWMSVSGLLGMISMAAFVVLTTALFELREPVVLRRAIRFGLLYGTISSTLLMLCEWLAMRRHTSHLWQWLSVGWITWFLWWVGMAYLLSDISGMD